MDPGHALSGVFAVVLMCLGLATIVYRGKKRIAPIEPSSLRMAIAYIAGLLLLYARNHGFLRDSARASPQGLAARHCRLSQSLRAPPDST